MKDIRYSSSKIKIYKSCPFRFFCKETDQKQDTDTDISYGQAGNVVHHALEYYFKNLLDIPKEFALVELKNSFNEEWEDCNIINPVIKKDLYWLSVINGINLNINPTHLEHEFRIVEDGINFIGYADVMNTNEHWIGDWKTSTYKKNKLEGYKEQLKYYAWAYRKEFGTNPMTWVYFNKVNKIFKYKFPDESLDNIELELKQIKLNALKRFKELKFERQPSRTNCYFCQFKGVCSTDLLRKKEAEKFEVVFHLKKNKVLIETSIPEIIHRKIEKQINFELKNAFFIKKAMLAKGIHYDAIKRLYKRKVYGAESFIGYTSVVYEELKQFAHSQGQKIRLVIKDYRNNEVYKNTIKVPNKLDVPFTLFNFQNKAVDVLIKNRWGIVEVGTGGGKTVIAAEAIRKLGLKTLFLIDNKDLLIQTKKEYEKMLGVNCGIVGMGYREWESDIVLATIQTVSKHAKEFVNELANFPLVIYDECLSADARILTEEGIKKIKNIVDSKYKGKILSYNFDNKSYEWKKILAHYKTEPRKNGYRVYLKNKTKPLKMTPEHKLYTTRGYVKAEDLKQTDILLKSKIQWSLKAKNGRKGENNPQYTGSNHVYGGRVFNNRTSKFKYKHQEVFCNYWDIEYIPNEYCIHHLDHNATNNKIENLLLMIQFNHKSYHNLLNSSIITAEQLLQEERIDELKKLKCDIKQEELIPIEIDRIEISKAHAGIHYYDIEVEDNHNFFANGVLSHNCHIIASKSFETVSKFLVNTKYRFAFCLDPMTQILTPNKKVRLGGLKIGDEVLSYNHNQKYLQVDKVANIFTKEVEELLYLRIQTSRGVKTIKSSLEHKFYTDRGYIKAEDLKKTDVIYYEHDYYIFEVFHKEYLTGMTLQQIADKYNYNYKTIRRKFHELNLKVRDCSEAHEGIPAHNKGSNPNRTQVRFSGYKRSRRLKIEERLVDDKIICEYCNESIKEGYVECHHKDRNRRNNKIDNLMILHTYCHSKLHYLNEGY